MSLQGKKWKNKRNLFFFFFLRKRERKSKRWVDENMKEKIKGVNFYIFYISFYIH